MLGPQWGQRKQMHPIRDSSFSTLYSHAYPVTPFLVYPRTPASSRVFGRSNRRNGSVACKFFCANVVVFHACFVQHLVQTLHHGWRTGNVVDGRPCVLQIPPEHLLIDETGFTAPGTTRFLHFSHAGNQLVLRIVSFQTLKLCEERRVLRPPI